MKIIFVALWILLPLNTIADNNPISEKIRLAVKDNISSFRKCFKEVLKSKPKNQGKIVLSWDVNDAGLVTKPIVKKSSINNTVVENCMIETLKTMTFPPAPSGNTVNIIYPFVFNKIK